MDSIECESTEERGSHFGNDWLEIFDKEGPPDLRLCVANTYVCLDAHKHILVERSPVFANMIFKRELDGSNVIKIEGVTLRLLNLIIWYMYSNELNTDSPKELIQMGKSAQKFEINGLIRSCKHKITCSSINRYNVWPLIEASKFFKLETFGERCLRFLKPLTKKTLFEMAEFLQTDSDTLFYILKRRDIFMKSEAFWMEGIIRWLQHHKSRDRFLLSVIKTFSLNYNEFLDLIEKYPMFFTSKEISRILCNMLRPRILEAPSWCEAGLKTNNVKPCLNYNDIATNALKINLECNRRFPKSFFCEEDEFEGTVVFEIKLTKHFPQIPCLLMLELAFGSNYVPRENLDLEFYHYEQNTVLVKNKIDFLLKVTENHYYLMINRRIHLHKNSPFVFALKLCASGLKKWGNDGPISSRQYRVAKIPEDIFQNICLNIDGYKSICLTFLSDWMVFVDPKYDKKNPVLTSLYFDSNIASEELSPES